jgi:hypothetical protein
LFYVNGSNELVAVAFTGDSTFTPGQQEVLFPLDGYLLGVRRYDVTRDDLRFVMLRIDDDTDDESGPELIWVQNFFEELRERVGN